jgi:hypothetical protein
MLSSTTNIVRLGVDFYLNLDPTAKSRICPQPLSVEPNLNDHIRYVLPGESGRNGRSLQFSQNFIDLINRIACAEAIDRKRRGYFKKYLVQVVRPTPEQELALTVEDSNPDRWTLNMFNEQQSNFNSLLGLVVGINLAHQTLGHFDKYQQQLAHRSSHEQHLNNLVTEEEWKAALEEGAWNSLQAGCLVDGCEPFFETCRKLDQRPEWTACFLPDSVSFLQLEKDLRRIQKKFFGRRS